MARRRLPDRKRRPSPRNPPASGGRGRLESHQAATPRGHRHAASSTRAASPVSKAPSPNLGLESRPGTSPGRATCRLARSIARTGASSRSASSSACFAKPGSTRRPFVATCGSGVTANSLLFAAHLIGSDHTGFMTAAGVSGGPTRRRRRRSDRPSRGRCGRRPPVRGGSFARNMLASGCARLPVSRAHSNASTLRQSRQPAGPSGGRSGVAASPASSHALAIASSSSQSAAGPSPNGSTSRSAWRTLASRDDRSA